MVQFAVAVEDDLVRVVSRGPGALELVAAHENGAGAHLPEVLHDQKVVVRLDGVPDDRIDPGEGRAVGLVVRRELALAVEVEGGLGDLGSHVHDLDVVAVDEPVLSGVEPRGDLGVRRGHGARSSSVAAYSSSRICISSCRRSYTAAPPSPELARKSSEAKSDHPPVAAPALKAYLLARTALESNASSCAAGRSIGA